LVDLPGPGEFSVVLVASIGFSMLVFSHASRHGSRHPTAWGIVGFLFAGVGALVYFVSYLLRGRRSPG
jgi:hypothetical protein